MKTTISKWKEVSRELVFDMYKKIEKVVYELPNGQVKDFYLNKSGFVVSMIAITKKHEIILARQYRPGPDKILFELPGGGVGNGETPEIAAERELLEETGYKGTPRLVAEYFDDAYSTLKRFCVVVIDCDKVADQSLDDSEFIEVVLLSIADFKKLLRSGQMTDIESGYLGLDYLNLL